MELAVRLLVVIVVCVRWVVGCGFYGCIRLVACCCCRGVCLTNVVG